MSKSQNKYEPFNDEKEKEPQRQAAENKNEEMAKVDDDAIPPHFELCQIHHVTIIFSA